ncbi:hypothetical protein HBH53_045120 [Parastagonospora nodorum]|nr:hypothetical protein HBH53_045120 [Parastagonospora nodorum]KAH4243422.1 hypothetical protein HBI05_083520 [Parastagonospora nodorum]KAH4244056.1 hypothetical protein HBI06_008520 [Parastagonospora nodorum]KAH4610027.1 hypothetical protein HBH82_059910 [Parastagonospora nodorum]KAH4691318.1 hypothetical protein HBH78_081080 [Parastagonospora nodorum]
MSTSTSNAVHANGPKVSNFARLADRLKDSMSTKRGPNPTSSRRFSAQHDLEDAKQNEHVTQSRRSSSTRYTEKMLHRLMHTTRPRSSTLVLNHLPVEILQNCFLHLDLFTLLRIRRVCKLWRDLVPGDSPMLAEELFLKPSYNLHAYSFTMATFDFDFEINVRPLPEQGPNLRVQSTYIDGLSLTRRCQGLIRTSGEIIFHPIIMDFNHYVQGDGAGRSKLVVKGKEEELGVGWQNMLISMPPLTELRISRTVGRKSKTMCVLKSNGGVRLGEVFETLSKWGKKELAESG